MGNAQIARGSTPGQIKAEKDIPGLSAALDSLKPTAEGLIVAIAQVHFAIALKVTPLLAVDLMDVDSVASSVQMPSVIGLLENYTCIEFRSERCMYRASIVERSLCKPSQIGRQSQRPCKQGTQPVARTKIPA